jgi:aminopeptidase-like protein
MIKDFIERHWNSNRLLLGKDSRNLLELMMVQFDIDLHAYNSGECVMTWRVPEEWVVHEAYIEDEQGNRYLDYADNPLHLVAYSTAIDKWVTWIELESHMYLSELATPWKFKYYERDWGFCSGHDEELWECLIDKKLHVVINTEFRQGTMLVGELNIGNKPNLVIASHYDHPYQANDGLSGVAVALEVAKRLQDNPPDWIGGVKFLFVPETIGSTAYFSDHNWDGLSGGIFLDACGNDNVITLQHSFEMRSSIDKIADELMFRKYHDFHDMKFRENFCNDEIVINSPPMDIPCIGLSRAPFPEYHTSADTIDIIHEDKLVEMADVTEEIVRRFCTDYIPIHTYSGVPFLSGYGLFVDPDKDLELNRNMEQIFMRFNGRFSISEIADEIGMDYWRVREFVEMFRTAGLIKMYPNGEDCND